MLELKRRAEEMVGTGDGDTHNSGKKAAALPSRDQVSEAKMEPAGGNPPNPLRMSVSVSGIDNLRHNQVGKNEGNMAPVECLLDTFPCRRQYQIVIGFVLRNGPIGPTRRTFFTSRGRYGSTNHQSASQLCRSSQHKNPKHPMVGGTVFFRLIGPGLWFGCAWGGIGYPGGATDGDLFVASGGLQRRRGDPCR